MPARAKERRGRGIAVRTDRTREDFLTLIANGYSIQRACLHLEIARSSVHKWFREEEEFKAQYEEALAAYNDVIRDEVHRRAITGVRRVRMMGGKLVFEREYSDRMLELLTKMRLPEAKELGAPVVSLTQNTLNVVQMTEEQLQDALRQRGIPLLSIEE